MKTVDFKGVDDNAILAFVAELDAAESAADVAAELVRAVERDAAPDVWCEICNLNVTRDGCNEVEDLAGTRVHFCFGHDLAEVQPLLRAVWGR